MINRYPGTCGCGARVAAGEGGYELLDGHAASPYQAAVFDAVADPRSGSKVVQAVAGAGKTTSIKNALRHMPPGRSVQLFAFNHKAAEDLKSAVEDLRRMDGPTHYAGVRAGTFHSVGFKALCRARGWDPKAVKPDDGKTRKVLKAHLGDEEVEMYGGFVSRLVRFAKGEGLGCLAPATEDQWYRLIEHHAMSLDHEDATEARAVEIATKALARGNHLAKERGFIDYEDMLYLVLHWRLRLFRNDDVWVDEAQDVSPTRIAMARLALRAGGRLFAVGDRFQSINGFAGAGVDALDRVAAEFNCGELPLTVSYRCSRAVVEDARRFVGHIEPAPQAREGSVEYDVSEEDALAELTADDAVLCRCTAPLVGLAYRLIAMGRAVRLAGREIGEGLIDLVEAMRARGIDHLVEKLGTWRDREVAKFVARGEETAAEAVADRVACVEIIVRSMPEDRERTVPGLIRRIEVLFAQDGGRALTLSTVHKSKGGEWPTVAILRPDLMPSRAARTAWAAAQEVNLQYVAATRAKTRLIYMRGEEA